MNDETCFACISWLEPPPTFVWTHPVHGELKSHDDYSILHDEYQVIHSFQSSSRRIDVQFFMLKNRVVPRPRWSSDTPRTLMQALTVSRLLTATEGKRLNWIWSCWTLCLNANVKCLRQLIRCALVLIHTQGRPFSLIPYFKKNN